MIYFNSLAQPSDPIWIRGLLFLKKYYAWLSNLLAVPIW
jgi:hypothetical protein